MERFQANQYLTKGEKRELAMSMNIEEKRIATWFDNMLQKKAAVGMPCGSELSSLMHYLYTARV